jgi:hypothetical protein
MIRERSPVEKRKCPKNPCASVLDDGKIQFGYKSLEE